MKRTLVFSLIAISSAAMGQETALPKETAPAPTATTKEEVPTLPETGDIAISIDATPFLNYAGKLLSDAGATSPSWNYLTDNQTIAAKYFLSPQFAVRGAIRLGFTNNSTSQAAQNRSIASQAAFPSQPSQLQNQVDVFASNVALSGGAEIRRGKGNLQGFMGAELGVAFSNSGSRYNYGNALTQEASTADVLNVDVTPSDEINGLKNVTTDPYGNQARVLSTNSGSIFGLGLRAFIGAEYFILPKLSLGGEFGWGIGFVSGGTSVEELESEGTVNGTQVLGKFKREVRNASRFGVDTESFTTVFGPQGRLKMTFHF